MTHAARRHRIDWTHEYSLFGELNEGTSITHSIEDAMALFPTRIAIQHEICSRTRESLMEDVIQMLQFINEDNCEIIKYTLLRYLDAIIQPRVVPTHYGRNSILYDEASYMGPTTTSLYGSM